MELDEIHETVLTKVKETRDKWEHDGMASYVQGMPIIVHIFRHTEGDPEDEPGNIATLMVRSDADQLGMVLKAVGGVMNFDAIAVSLDIWTSKNQINPHTGEEWGPNEMAFLASEYPDEAKKLLTSAVNVTTFNREGNYKVTVTDYEVEDGEIVYSDPLPAEEIPEWSVAAEGLIEVATTSPPDAVLEMIDKFTANSEMFGPGFSEAFKDVATIALLTEHEYLLASNVGARKDSERAKWIQKAMDMVNRRHSNGSARVKMKVLEHDA